MIIQVSQGRVCLLGRKVYKVPSNDRGVICGSAHCILHKPESLSIDERNPCTLCLVLMILDSLENDGLLSSNEVAFSMSTVARIMSFYQTYQKEKEVHHKAVRESKRLQRYLTPHNRHVYFVTMKQTNLKSNFKVHGSLRVLM